MIFHNPQRLQNILNASRRPVQIVYAGKAHPADEGGKHHLQQVYRRAIDPSLGGRIAFVDDYDLHVAHFLVQGCDVWLNNPAGAAGQAARRHEERRSTAYRASLDIGDSWWAERLRREQRVADRRRREPATGAQDAARMPRNLRSPRREIVPTFYDRDNGIPSRWLTIVRNAIVSVAPRFSARRMVKDYVENMYAPALQLKTGVGQ